MRAAILVLLVFVTVPALGCPPMRTRNPVDPVVALMERFDDRSITNEEIAAIVESAKAISRERSRTEEQRARALALAAAWTWSKNERAAKQMLKRAFVLDREAARGVAAAQGAEPLVQMITLNHQNEV